MLILETNLTLMSSNTATLLSIVSFTMLFSILACNSNKMLKADQPVMKKEMGKVIIEIQPDYTAEELVLDYSAYELENKSKVSKTLNAFLFTYNSEIISEEELLAMLKTNINIVMARSIRQDPEMQSQSVKKVGKRSLKASK